MLAGEVHCLCLMCGGAQILTDKRMDDKYFPQLPLTPMPASTPTQSP
jgi:hypothetical protein